MGFFLGHWTLVRDRFAEMHAATWRAVRAEFKTGMCETKSWGLRFCGVFLGTLVRDRFAEMRAVTWRAVRAEFKTGMCEMKSWGLRFCGFFLGTLV